MQQQHAKLASTTQHRQHTVLPQHSTAIHDRPRLPTWSRHSTDMTSQTHSSHKQTQITNTKSSTSIPGAHNSVKKQAALWWSGTRASATCHKAAAGSSQHAAWRASKAVQSARTTSRVTATCASRTDYHSNSTTIPSIIVLVSGPVCTLTSEHASLKLTKLVWQHHQAALRLTCQSHRKTAVQGVAVLLRIPNNNG